MFGGRRAERLVARDAQQPQRRMMAKVKSRDMPTRERLEQQKKKQRWARERVTEHDRRSGLE